MAAVISFMLYIFYHSVFFFFKADRLALNIKKDVFPLNLLVKEYRIDRVGL